MLIAFISLIAVVDWVLGEIDAVVDGKILGGILLAKGEYEGWFPGSLQTIFGTVFAPFAFLLGVPWKEAPLVGNLLGQKICVNEFVAYFSMQDMMANNQLSDRSIMISTYALCGFANFSSIGIQIGGIGALARERRGELSRLALRAMVVGALVSCLTACIAGLLVEGNPPAGVVGAAPAAVVEVGS
jgi:CNT family concentrative nucleoside transporter